MSLNADWLYQGLTEDDYDVWVSEQAAAADPPTETEEYEYWHGGDDG